MNLHDCRIAYLIVLIAAIFSVGVDGGETIDGFVVVLVDEAEVTASVEGPITSIAVTEGQAVVADATVAVLDDEPWKIRLALIEQEVKIADALATQTHAIDVAQANVDQHRRKLEEHAVQSEMDRQRALNELLTSAAEKSEAVAKNEWSRAQDARGKFADSVSVSEVESLRLAYERARLETREAKFQNGIAKLNVQLNESIAASLQTELNAALIRLEAAKSAQTILRMEVTKTRLRLKQAEADLADRHLRSPIAGQVVSVVRRKGDWVAAGDVLARVVGLNRLRVEGYTTADKIDRLSGDSALRLEVVTPTGQSKPFSPRDQFISPEVDAVTGEVRVWFEFENVDNAVKPGYRARLILGDD